MLICRAVVFLLFKEKTAYEMRISDWSSDVCSSDLVRVAQDDRIVARIFDDEPKPLIPLFKFAQQTLEFVLAFAGADGGTDGTGQGDCLNRSEEHTSELQSLMRNSYAVFCLKKKKHEQKQHKTTYI